MLSIRHMASGSENYYLQLAREDYYLEGGEPPGKWFGSALPSLGLGYGTVEKEALRALMDGFAPDGQPLVQNAGKPNRQPGWDLTFSAPKSVSTLWSQADAELLARIEAAHESAVRQALAYLESEAAWTRRGHGGVESERVGLIAAMFEHGTSRAQQPQLHTHALVLNAGVRGDGTWGSIRSQDFYSHKMLVGAVYRAAFAHELRFNVNVDPTPVKSWFELAGVPGQLAEHFSLRRREIDDAVGGAAGASAARLAAAALATRSHKEHRPRAELMPRWHREGTGYGFGPTEAAALPRPSSTRAIGPDNILVIEPVRAALKDLVDHRSFIRRRDLMRAAVERMQDGHADLSTIRTAVQRELDGLIEVGNENGYSIYATREMLDAERDILQRARAMQSLDALALGAPTAELDGLTQEQAEALDHIVASPGGIKIVDGVAGSGKSSLLRAAKARWEDAGFTVIGATVAGKAARELEAASGIKSDTVAKTLHRLDGSRTRHKHTQPLSMNSRCVLVIDEASMIGTLQLRDLIRHAQNAQAKVVLVGDERQLPAIDAGAPFSSLIRSLGAARLTDVKRQHDEQHRLATTALSEGDVQTALSIYQHLGRFMLYENQHEATAHLVGLWHQHRTSDLAQSLMLAGTNRQVDRLNELAQRVRKSRRELHGAGVQLDNERFHVGDRVRFTLNSRTLGVWNGDGGVITGMRRRSLRHFDVTVRLDAHAGFDWLGRPRVRSVVFNTAAYRSIRLGYAATTHSAQGTTVDRAFVLAGGTMASAELSYVQLTRHREDLYIAAPRNVFGEDLEAIAEAMAGTIDCRQAIDFIGSGPGIPPREWTPVATTMTQEEEQEMSP